MNQKLTAEVASLKVELTTQKALVGELLKRLYGPKSEQMNTNQLLLAFLEDESKKPSATAPEEDLGAVVELKAKSARATRTNKLSDSLKNLPTIERIVTASEVLEAPEQYRLIGEEVSERLHINPQSFTREIIRRQTHVKRGDLDGAPITPPLEACLLPGSILTPSLGAYLLTEKFCYHQPFYRLEWRMRATHGIELRRDLMCSWHNHLAEMMRPLHQRIAELMRSSEYLKIDETPIRCLDPGKGKTSQGYLWAYHHPQYGVLFDWHNSRANDCLDSILIDTRDPHGSFRGHLQSDGFSAYETFVTKHPKLNITPVSCLAHIRRKFVEAKEDQPRISSWMLLQIGKMYRLEAKLRERNATPALRARARRRWSLRIYHHLIGVTKHLILRRRITPKSPLGKALHYAQAEWPQLAACFENGQLELDNNAVENAIRPTKLGHKNWMFVGGKDTGWRSAVIYTFVEQVRSRGADPYAYFEWVFEKLMRQSSRPSTEHIDELLPTAWLQAMHQSKIA